MAAIVAPIQRPPAGRKLFWGMEDVAVGTPPAGTVGHPIFVEPITSFDDSQTQRDIYDAAELTGVMSDMIGQEEETHYLQGSISTPHRMHGISTRALACLMGNQSYTPSLVSTGHYLHTIPLDPYTVRTNTMALWWQTTVPDALGSIGYIKQFLRCTISSVQLTFGAGAPLNSDIGIWGEWPTFKAPPAGFSSRATVTGAPTSTSIPLTPVGSGTQFIAGVCTIGGNTATITTITGDTLTVTGLVGAPSVGDPVVQAATNTGIIYIGSDATYKITRTQGYQGTFHIKGSTGADYLARVLSGTITLTRNAEAVYAADSQTIIDIALGPLSVNGSMVFQFDGYAPGTVARDFHDFIPVGTFIDPNTLRWTDSNGDYVEIQSAPWRWNPFSLDYSGNFVKGSGTFTASNDPAQAIVGAPALSVVKNLLIRNSVSTPLILP
jgi:hypothetical protein